MSILSLDILQEIFVNLSILDIIACIKVCRDFRQVGNYVLQLKLRLLPLRIVTATIYYVHESVKKEEILTRIEIGRHHDSILKLSHILEPSYKQVFASLYKVKPNHKFVKITISTVSVNHDTDSLFTLLDLLRYKVTTRIKAGYSSKDYPNVPWQIDLNNHSYILCGSIHQDDLFVASPQKYISHNYLSSTNYNVRRNCDDWKVSNIIMQIITTFEGEETGCT